MKLLNLLSICVLFLCTEVHARGTQVPEVEEGDLVFVQSPASKLGPFAEAIQKTGVATVKWLRENGIEVPESKEKDTPDHVALVVNSEDYGMCVVEALPQVGVILTPIQKFWDRNSGAKVFVGKLDEDLKPLVPHAVMDACQKIGRPYADLFSRYQDSDKYYCTSLVQYAFRTANNNQPVFITPVYKMMFKPDSFWVKYFKARKAVVPLGLKGSNPTEFLHSPEITYETYSLPAPLSLSPGFHLVLKLRGTSN